MYSQSSARLDIQKILVGEKKIIELTKYEKMGVIHYIQSNGPTGNGTAVLDLSRTKKGNIGLKRVVKKEGKKGVVRARRARAPKEKLVFYGPKNRRGRRSLVEEKGNLRTYTKPKVVNLKDFAAYFTHDKKAPGDRRKKEVLARYIIDHDRANRAGRLAESACKKGTFERIANTKYRW